MGELVWSHILYITIEGVNTVLHTIGLPLLVSIYKRGENDTQGIFLINLAATELYGTLLQLHLIYRI